MTTNKEFWETLQQKYEDRNRLLLQKEQELRLKLDAMENAIGDVDVTKKLVQASARELADAKQILTDFAEIASMSANNTLSSILEKSGCDVKECNCESSAEKSGFFNSVFEFLRFGSKEKRKIDKVEAQKWNLAEISKGSEFDKVSFSDQSKKKDDTSTLDSDNCVCCSCDEDHNKQEEKTSDCQCLTCEETTELCACNLEDFEKSSTRKVPLKHKVCSGGLCVSSLKDFPTKKYPIREHSQKKPDETSIKSLESIDLQHMQNIYNLATQQKVLLKEVTRLEQKEKVFDSVFDTSERRVTAPSGKNQAELQLENALLKNELKDMRLEVRQYLEKMEGPMQYKIESERYKCHKLEQKLEEAVQEQHKLQNFYQKELDTIKMQLYCANTSIHNLVEENKKLKLQLVDLDKKCQEQNTDLIRLKISEGEALKKMQSLIDCQPVSEKTQEDCNLHEIARELSRILKDCEPCGVCANLPDDLTEAAKLLKNLSDLVDERLITYTKNDENIEETAAKQVLEQAKEEKVEIREEGKDLCICTECPVDGPDLNSKDVVSRSGENKIVAIEETTGNNLMSKVEVEEKSEVCICVVCPFTDSLSSIPLLEVPEKQSVAVPVEPPPEIVPTFKASLCKCARTKKTKEVDQIWPTINRSVSMKEYSEENLEVSSKKPCSCSVAKKIGAEKRTTETPEHPGVIVKKIAQTVVKSLDQFKMDHYAKGSSSRNKLESDTYTKAFTLPFDVDTQVDVINKPPQGILITTSITNSGTLEVITESAEGTIETTVVYTSSGNVEVATEVQSYNGFQLSGNDLKALLAEEIKEITENMCTNAVQIAELDKSKALENTVK